MGWWAGGMEAGGMEAGGMEGEFISIYMYIYIYIYMYIFIPRRKAVPLSRLGTRHTALLRRAVPQGKPHPKESRAPRLFALPGEPRSKGGRQNGIPRIAPEGRYKEIRW